MALFSELQFNPENPIPIRKENDVERLYFGLEKSFMAAKGYWSDSITTELRDKAVLTIAAQAASQTFDPVVPYLALNYFDRSIKLTGNDSEIAELMAVSCLTLAWKMRDLTFTIPQFLAERPTLDEFTLELVASMEYCIIRELDWKLRPVLALSYVPRFASRLETEHGISQDSVREILIYAQYDIFYTRFRPSVLAAAAILAACHFLYPEKNLYYFFKLASLSFLQKRKKTLKKCREGMILRCHELNLTINSGVLENETEPRLQVRARLVFPQANAREEESALWDEIDGKVGELSNIEESEEGSEDDEISLRRTKQKIRDLEIAAMNESKGKGVKIVEREETRDAKMAAVSKDKGKGVKIEESEEEEESEDERFGLCRNRQKQAVSISEKQALEELIDEENLSNEAVMGEENPSIEAVIENPSNGEKTQGSAMDKGNGDTDPELDMDSDSSVGSINPDLHTDLSFQDLQLCKEKLENIRHILEQSATESETESPTQVEVTKEEPIAELEEAPEEFLRTDLLKFSDKDFEAEAEAAEGSDSEFFTLPGIQIPPMKCSSQEVSEARGESQRARLRVSAKDVGGSGELREPLIDHGGGSDSEEEEASSGSGGPSRQKRCSSGYCSGCSCSLL